MVILEGWAFLLSEVGTPVGAVLCSGGTSCRPHTDTRAIHSLYPLHTRPYMHVHVPSLSLSLSLSRALSLSLSRLLQSRLGLGPAPAPEKAT